MESSPALTSALSALFSASSLSFSGGLRGVVVHVGEQRVQSRNHPVSLRTGAVKVRWRGGGRGWQGRVRQRSTKTVQRRMARKCTVPGVRLVVGQLGVQPVQ